MSPKSYLRPLLMKMIDKNNGVADTETDHWHFHFHLHPIFISTIPIPSWQTLLISLQWFRTQLGFWVLKMSILTENYYANIFYQTVYSIHNNPIFNCNWHYLDLIHGFSFDNEGTWTSTLMKISVFTWVCSVFICWLLSSVHLLLSSYSYPSPIFQVQVPTHHSPFFHSLFLI